MRERLAVVTLGALVGFVACGESSGTLTVGHLRWDARERPLGIIQFEPRLDWRVSSLERGQRQSAYQILVASDPDKLRVGKADVWDSGKVLSEDSINVHYRGPTPKARQRAFWTVRVWDKNDRPSSFAPPSWWEMGLYDEEWEGKWIGRPRSAKEPEGTHDRSAIHVRKAFTLGQDVERARLYASAFGVYEASINGQRAGDSVLAPGFTDYEKRVLFQTYDVTSLVRRGENVLGAVVGGGWCTAALGGRSGACGYEPPRVMMQLEVTLADGSLQTFVTDETWTSHAGPIVSAHLYDGEVYDARLEMTGWDTPGFDARFWQPVEQYDREKERDLVADPGPAMRVTEDLTPVGMTEPSKGVFVFDFGQNVVGWAKLKAEGPAATTVTLWYAEALRHDGTPYVENLRSARATDKYTMRGQGSETWEPRFSVHAFRYVELRGLASPPPLSALVGRVVHSEMRQTGWLETSNPLLNRLFSNIQWSQRSAFLSVPTTGPGRDERLGSMLEAQVFAETACLNRDVQTFYRKWMDDIRDAQRPDAAYTDTAPLVQKRGGGAAAGAAGILVPWALYRCYADRTPLDRHLPSMGRWLEFLKSKNPDLVWTNELGEGLGDPLEIGPPTDKTLVATALLVRTAEALAQMMRHGGPNLDLSARAYDALAEGARSAFVRSFLLPDGRLKSDTQSAYALAIAGGVLSGDARARAGQRLVAAIEREGTHLTTGVVGTSQLLSALSLVGRDDLAYALLLQESCPSWFCSMRNGATTIWEKWDGFTKEKGFADSESNSLNHYAFGAIGEWMYDAIGGIALDPLAPAGKHVFVRPRPHAAVTHARGRFDSLYGPITTDWSSEGGSFRLKVSIPAGATATVTLPCAGKATEGRVPIDRASGVKVVESGSTRTVVDIESGTYDFAVPLP